MKLLLAEDEKALSKALVTILKHNNYTVDAVFNGEDALDYLLQGGYDGAILDIMMPKKDGISVLKELRKTNKSLPVLLLTARTEVEDKVLGLDSGADDYLGKPFDVQELLARVRAMLRRSGQYTLYRRYHLKPFDLRAEIAERLFQAKQQGVSDNGASYLKRRQNNSDRKTHGKNMGF